ncbi:hypothetical protein [Microvirga sesbaniae]|uniref:hypothetical protein n=1 Tax=Microvirga sesbaniae TaxID=681392 RepID=UPI0021C89003|nr:hypothetical protein [Microvirga sp. HBU67692]
MTVRIAKRQAPTEPWRVPVAAVLGFLTGIGLAVFRHFSHSHPGYSPDALVAHFVPHLAATVTACTVLSVLTALLHNRLVPVVVVAMHRGANTRTVVGPSATSYRSSGTAQ